MPAANPWKKDAKEPQAAVAPEQPDPPPAATGPQSRLRSRGVARGASKDEPKAPEPEPPAAPPEEDDDQKAGKIKNLAGFFATQTGEVKVVRKKRLEVEDTPDEKEEEELPIARLEGVIRSDDPGEWQKPIELEKGWAKNLASKFLNREDDASSGATKKPFVMDLDQSESTVLESEPDAPQEGIVRSVDKTKDVMGKRGRIKNLAGRFASATATGDDDEGGGGPVGEGYHTEAAEVERGKARDMAQRFRQKPGEGNGEQRNGPAKPLWMVELETAAEHGVFENEPEVREDVVHADDEQPDVISVQHTRNLRAMWSAFEKDEMKDKEAPRRADILVRPKKKEPSPEPEPPPPPVVEQPKGRFGAGAAKKFGPSAANVGVTYGKVAAGQAKKEPSPPPVEAATAKKGVGVKGKGAQQPPPPEPAESKDSKGFTKPALKSVAKKK